MKVRGLILEIDFLNKHMEHVIIDSGVYTFLFGAENETKVDFDFFQRWQDDYVHYIETSGLKNAHFVEVDVQKKLGIEPAWELRRALCDRVGKDRIINVVHLEDRDPTALIEFSDYIAISIPEMKMAIEDSALIEKRIMSISILAKQRGKKVHLLGCTDRRSMRMFRTLDSCDSTTWMRLLKFGAD